MEKTVNTHVVTKHFVAWYLKKMILFVCPQVQLVCGVRNSRFSMFPRVKIYCNLITSEMEVFEFFYTLIFIFTSPESSIYCQLEYYAIDHTYVICRQ